MDLAHGDGPVVHEPSPRTSSAVEPDARPDALAILYSVFRSLRAERLSFDGYTAALRSVSLAPPRLHCPLFLADPARIAGAAFRAVVLHDLGYLPTRPWPPYRFGVGRTLWGSLEEALDPLRLGDLGKLANSIGDRARRLFEELLREGGFLLSDRPEMRARASRQGRLAQVLERIEVPRADGELERRQLLKLVGDRGFTIVRQIGEQRSEGCCEIEVCQASTFEDVVQAMYPDRPTSLAACRAFGMLREPRQAA